ncbi:MAG: DUF2207 domain-containing protein [Microbacteriaceae bacterium]
MRLSPVIAAFVLALVPFAVAAPLVGAAPVVAAAPTHVLPPASEQLKVPTAAADFTFTSFTGDYYLGRDDGRNATLRTVETLVAQFPDTDQNHGIERMLPTRYGDADLHLSVVSVADAAGTPLHYSRTDSDDYATLRIGDADRYVHGTQTYVITYTTRNVVRSFADTKADEFYWDVNGTGWAQPFGRVTARVHLQPTLTGTLTGNQVCYRGAEGSADRCAITHSGNTFTADATGLGPHENVTVAIGFHPSTFAKPPILKDNWLFTVVPWVLVGLSVLLAGWALWSRVFRWRDAPGRPTIIAEYTPPKNLHPALAAELLGRRKTGLSAQIVSFAVNRVVRIREFPDERKDTRYQLELLQEDAPSLSEPERVILTTLFGTVTAGRTMRLDRRDLKLGDRLASHRDDEKKRVRTLALRTKPRTKLTKRLRWLTLALIAASFGHSWLANALRADTGWTVLTTALVVVIGICGWIWAAPPYRLTAKGAELRDHLRGLRLYIQLAEVDRIRMLQAPGTAERIDITDRSAVIALYEKLLPYAMIFGLEKQWIGELEQNYAQTQAPDWYAGTNNLASVAFLTGVVGTGNFATTPPPSSSYSGSSSSGGSSGGGFSGGGGGGGGGGGW